MSIKLFNTDCEIFVTSDPHLCHNKDFLYVPRGFKSIEEHDETVIANWNETVSPNDIVIVTGDIIMGSDRDGGLEKLSRLNGRIAICRGNHDTDGKMIDYLSKCPNIDQSLMNGETYANIFKIGKWSFYVSHHPTMINDFEFIKPGHKEFCLHGHTHSKDKFQFLQHCCYNIAMDAHGNRPVNIKTVQKDLIEAMQKMFQERAKKGNEQ